MIAGDFSLKGYTPRDLIPILFVGFARTGTGNFQMNDKHLTFQRMYLPHDKITENHKSLSAVSSQQKLKLNNLNLILTILGGHKAVDYSRKFLEIKQFYIPSLGLLQASNYILYSKKIVHKNSGID